MKALTVKNGVRLEVDPTEYYPANISVSQLVDACGLVLPWALEYYIDEDIEKPGLARHLENRYQFPTVYTPCPHAVDDAGVFRYKDDPPQYPLVRVESEDTPEIFLMYQHAIVVIIDKKFGQANYTRMD